jgi:hypothetical protein
MPDHFMAIILDESKWLFFSIITATLATVTLLHRHRKPVVSPRGRVMTAMNLFFGLTIGTMAFGHLLAVTTKHIVGTLEGPWMLFYAIGIAMAVPSWWLIYHARSFLIGRISDNRRTLLLNGWIALTLSVLGLHNVPLALTGLLNIGYHLHSGRVAGGAIVGIAIVVNITLFIGSILFFASGQSFEQLSGME